MLIVLLSWCSAAVVAQDAPEPKPRDAPAVTYDAPWSSDGQYSLIDPRIYGGNAENMDFSNFWGPYSTSSFPINGEMAPTREDGVSGFDYGPVVSSPTFQTSGGDDSNSTYPYIYPLNPLEVARQAPKPEANGQAASQGPSDIQTMFYSPGVNPPKSSEPSPPVPQSPSDARTVFPMLYTPALSISGRRRYTNEAGDAQTSQQPPQNATEPLSSSYEETFTRVIPPMPVPGVPMPPGGLPPYGGFGYPPQFFPFPGLVPPGLPLLPLTPRGRELPPTDGRREEARFFGGRESAVENLEEQAIEARTVPVPVPGQPGLYGAPLNVPNPYFFPYLAPGLRPPMFQRYAGPRPIPARDPISRPVPAPPIAPADAANEVVPPQFPPPPPFQRFPFAWLPNFTPRFLPPPPPEAALPADQPPVPAVVDRLPLDADVEAVPVPPPAVPALKPLDAEGKPLDAKPQDSVPYEFGYDMNDGKGNDQHRMEQSNGAGEVRGSYGFRDLFGVYRLVNYVADKNGFRAHVRSNEPGVASAGSADVIVQAEVPPPHAVEESLRALEPEATVVQGVGVEAAAVVE